MTVIVYVGFAQFSMYMSPSFLRAMRRYQNYEYTRHWKKILSIFLTFTTMGIAGSLAIAVITAGLFATYIDRSFHLATPHKYAMFYFVPDPQTGVLSMSVSQLYLAIPFALYFAWMSFFAPHDCFECFNRLSTKRYSIFQYMQQERALQRDRQYGQGAIDRFNELL